MIMFTFRVRLFPVWKMCWKRDLDHLRLEVESLTSRYLEIQYLKSSLSHGYMCLTLTYNIGDL